MALESERALLRGDVVGPAGPITEGSRLTSFYVTSPVYFTDEFATYAGPAGEVVVAWLVPVSDAEAGLVARAGWEAFENEFVLGDPDLVDFHRPPMQV
ncbi:suppressor of fused domain protein [Aeromicrobium erythreum]|uniref:suppressor of fused domain protein n=1 Tax=Aeromicrobium erythreum TaxID=2041 RepID=UPI0008375CB0|nr:suppressor of fused domain protein [Aeromicrobium erythreum]